MINPREACAEAFRRSRRRPSVSSSALILPIGIASLTSPLTSTPVPTPARWSAGRGEPEVYAETADLHQRLSPGNPDWGHPPLEDRDTLLDPLEGSPPLAEGACAVSEHPAAIHRTR